MGRLLLLKRTGNRVYVKKREITPEKIEEIDHADLVGGELIDILKPLLIGLAVACFAVFICAKYL